jgi:hypothetical protein
MQGFLRIPAFAMSLILCGGSWESLGIPNMTLGGVKCKLSPHAQHGSSATEGFDGDSCFPNRHRLTGFHRC